MQQIDFESNQIMPLQLSNVSWIWLIPTSLKYSIYRRLKSQASFHSIQLSVLIKIVWKSAGQIRHDQDICKVSANVNILYLPKQNPHNLGILQNSVTIIPSQYGQRNMKSKLIAMTFFTFCSFCYCPFLKSVFVNRLQKQTVYSIVIVRGKILCKISVLFCGMIDMNQYLIYHIQYTCHV